MMNGSVETLFATIVAMQNIQTRITAGEEHLEKALVSLQEKYDTIYETLDDETRERVDVVNIDGDTNTSALMSSYELLKGEMPEFHDEAVISQILKEQGHSLDDLEKGRINIANLTPVRRQVKTRDGRTYLKTVYVKKEEMSVSTQKGRRFLAQAEAEKTMKKGDKIRARFLGWNSQTEYQSDSLKIAQITDSHIIAEFTEDWRTPRGHVYGPNKSDQRDRIVKIPRVGSKAWNEKTSFEKKPEPRGPVKVTSMEQISVGDKVKTKIGGNLQEVEITYIHPRGQFAKVKDSEGNVSRKSLSKLLIAPPERPEDKLLSDKKIKQLKSGGVNINFGDRLSDSDIRKIEAFNRAFPGYDLEEWVNETKAVIEETLGSRAASQTNINISIQSNGSFSLSVYNSRPKLQMDRNFSVGSNGKTSVYHALFKVDSSKQGTGIGKKLFKALYKQYRNSGISEIGVTANIDVGGYAWGQYGFTCTKSTAESLARRFTVGRSNTRVGYAITSGDQVSARERVREFYRENPDSARFPVHLLCTIGPDHKAGKVALLGTNWSGQIDLTNQTQKAHFENYIGMAR